MFDKDFNLDVSLFEFAETDAAEYMVYTFYIGMMKNKCIKAGG